jgi:uroporphyrin-III C-methyltransferase/precorrin-2 dehydrogenase/sirohydrochlorin ferrochelatase
MVESTPAAIVERGTLPQQKVHIGTLKTLPQIIAANEVCAPTLLIIGEVVKLHDQLSWYESVKPKTS